MTVFKSLSAPFLEGNNLAIFDIDQYINRFDYLPINKIIKEPIFPFLIQKIQTINFAPDNASDLKIICATLHSFSLLTSQKTKKFNLYLNENFVQKLIFLANQNNLPLTINSLWCISNLISVSYFSFERFYQNNLFQILKTLLSLNEEVIFTLCAVISQASIDVLNKKCVDYTQEGQNAKCDATIIIDILHSVINCSFEKAKTIGICSIPSIIDLISNNLDRDKTVFYLNAAFSYLESDDPYLFGATTQIIYEFLRTDNFCVYEILKYDDRVLNAIKKGLNFPETVIRTKSIKSLCQVIIGMDDLHFKISEFGLIKDIFAILNEGEIESKIRCVEAISRILYNDDSPLLKEVIDNGGIEFLCDSLSFAAECIADVIDLFIQLISKQPPINQLYFKRLADYGLVEILDDAIDEIGDNDFFRNDFVFDEAAKKKADDTIEKINLLKKALIDYMKTQTFIE